MPAKQYLLMSLLFHGFLGLVLFLFGTVDLKSESALEKRAEALAGATVDVLEQQAPAEPPSSKKPSDDPPIQIAPISRDADEKSRTLYSGKPSEANATSLGAANQRANVEAAESSSSLMTSQETSPPPDPKPQPEQPTHASLDEPKGATLAAALEPMEASNFSTRSTIPPLASSETDNAVSQSLAKEQHRSDPEAVQVQTASRATDEQQSAATSDVLESDGVRVPNFQFQDFSISQMNDIVSGGQAVFIVFCGNKMFAVSGSLSEPKGLSLVTASQLTRLSLRAVAVPQRSCHAALDMLRFKYSVPEDDLQKAHIRLLMTNALDGLILERQREAAQRLNRPLENLQLTAGSLRFAQQRVIDFEIKQVRLQDGSVVNMDRSQPSAKDL